MSDILSSSIIQSIIIIAAIAIIIGVIYKNLSFGRFFSGTSILEGFSRDITREIREGKSDLIIGRESEINQLAVILGRRTKNNAILVGEAGVGKTAIVEGLAQKIVDGTIPKDLKNKRILALDLNALMAGTKYRGDFESRIKRLVDEISSSGRNIILFIDEIHNLMVMENSSENLSVGDILKPAMARGELQVIGASTPMEYKKYFRNDPALERRLQPIIINEPTQEEILEILTGIKDAYAAYHRIIIPDGVLPVCIEEAAKIMPDRFFPDKAIDLLDEAASQVKIKMNQKKSHGAKPTLSAKDIIEVAQKYSAN